MNRNFKNEDELDQESTELLLATWELYREEIESRRPEDYEVYVPNMSKLMAMHGFLKQIAQEFDGKVDELKFDRRETFGEIIAYFRYFALEGEDLIRFCDLVKGADNFDIEPLTDGTVSIGMTFRDIFKKIK